MKVLHLSYYGPEGATGGAISTRRLHFALRKAGIDSKILNKQRADESLHFVAFRASKIERKVDSLLRKVILLPLGLRSVEGVGSLKIRKNEAYLDADIIHFHRIFEFFSYLALPWLTKSKPVVFTLHDMWSFTGHCYASLDCDRWKIGCGKCPYLDIFPFQAIGRDSTRLEWKLKNWAYSHSNLSIVTPSRWLAEQAKQSMLNRFPIHWIPHGIDTEVYKPLDKEQCRSVLGIPFGKKKVLAFVAMALNNYIKGGDLLLKALESLPESLKAEIVLLLLGHGGRHITNSVGIQTIDFGYVYNDRLKAICYAAADLLIHPARGDNFGLVLLESMACGTPVISFRVGGVPELVRPGITGYLAKPENTEDFRDGMVQLLEDEPRRNHMRQQCRAIALKEYNLELWVQRCIELYRQLLQR